MTITTNCPSCDRQLRVKDELAGKKVRCPECKEPVAIDAAEEPAEEPAEETTERPASTAKSGELARSCPDPEAFERAQYMRALLDHASVERWS